MSLLRAGYKAYRDERYWQLYCATYPYMSAETFQTFEQFKLYLTGSGQKSSTKEQILGKVEGMLNTMTWKQAEV